MRFTLLLAATLLLGNHFTASAQAIEEDHDDDHRVARIPAAKNVAVSICVSSGNIIIRGWDKSEVLVDSSGEGRVDFRRRDGTEKTAPATTVDVLISDSESDDPGGRGGCSSSGDITLNVPRDARLTVRTVEGDVDVDDVGEAKVESASGTLSARKVANGVDLNTASGEVSVDEAGGRIRLRSISGGIVANDLHPRDDGDALSVNSTSGDVRLSRISLNNVEVRSISGGIYMNGPLARNARYQMTTLSGDITFVLPVNSSFHVEAKVFQGGDIVTDFPLKYTGNHQPSKILAGGSIEGTVGSGESFLNLSSHSGTVRLRKKH
jgi:DUF4097 and DUF4098 domain-containing protein YvlB